MEIVIQPPAISLATACGSTLYRFQYCIISSNKATSTGFYGIYFTTIIMEELVVQSDSNGDDHIAIVTSASGSFNSASYMDSY